VGLGGFSLMDNHTEVLVRLDPDVVKGSSDEQSASGGTSRCSWP
jgi:hypothetical protein